MWYTMGKGTIAAARVCPKLLAGRSNIPTRRGKCLRSKRALLGGPSNGGLRAVPVPGGPRPKGALDGERMT